MVKTVLDSSIVIDYLNGITPARKLIDASDEAAISIMTWIEVMVGADETTGPRVKIFLRRFELIPLDDAIADLTVALRRTHRLKLPDAIIWASSNARSRVLLTRNTKDFPRDDPSVQFPYRLP